MQGALGPEVLERSKTRVIRPEPHCSSTKCRWVCCAKFQA